MRRLRQNEKTESETKNLNEKTETKNLDQIAIVLDQIAIVLKLRPNSH